MAWTVIAVPLPLWQLGLPDSGGGSGIRLLLVRAAVVPPVQRCSGRRAV